MSRHAARYAAIITAAVLLALLGAGIGDLMASAPAAEAQGQPPLIGSWQFDADGNCTSIAVTSWTRGGTWRYDTYWQWRYRATGGDWVYGTRRRARAGTQFSGLYFTLLNSQVSCTSGGDVAIKVEPVSSWARDTYWPSVAVPALPSQVAGIRATSANSTRVSIAWDTPPAAQAITGYYAEIRQNQGESNMASWTRTTKMASVNSHTFTGLTAGTAYEVRVAATTAAGAGRWSETLFVRTAADLFANDPPDDVRVSVIRVTDTLLNLRVEWSAVANATGYQIERGIGNLVTTLTPAMSSDLHLEDNYTKTANQTGELAYRVRARRGSGGSAQYTPWSPAVYYRFYGAGQVDAPAALEQEIAGNRAVPDDVQAVRDGVGGAVEQVIAPTGVTADTQDLVNLLGLLPGLGLFGLCAYSGWRYGMTALGLGLGYVMLTMSLYVSAALLGFPIIWPMALTLVGVIAGGGGIARRLGWV